MSLTGSESSVEGLSPRDLVPEPNAVSGSLRSSVSPVWLDGDVSACACPECAAPMTIRLWLSMAECRRCGTQVELTEEQERLAHRLPERRSTTAPPPPGRRRPEPLRPERQFAAPPSLLRAIQVREATPVRLVAVPVVEPPTQSLPAAVPFPRRSWGKLPTILRSVSTQWLETMLSCLVSLLVHMVLVIVLGLWFYPKPKAAPLILLGEFELQPAGPRGAELPNPIVIQAAPRPAVAAAKSELPRVPKPIEPLRIDLKRELDRSIVEPTVPLPSFVALGHVRPGTMFAGRDPHIRRQVVRQEGGNDQSERAVALGLKWLAHHQSADGRWSLHQFQEAGDCDGQCNATGLHSDTAATALGILPFLGAGYTHEAGGYREPLRRALEWLVADQQADGTFGHLDAGTMYAHGQATIALCEAYALTRDRRLLEPAQQAVDYIVRAQHSGGGWRYVPGQRGDLSVTGWEVMALRSAKSAQLGVPEPVPARVGLFLNAIQSSPEVGAFGYLGGERVSAAMTAEGLLCRQYGGWKADHPPLLAGADFLWQKHPPDERDVNMYYWYYATQVMHHLGGPRRTR